MNIFDEVKSRCSILTVISTYCVGESIIKAGKLYKMKSPFQNEKTPSFMIYEHTNSFYDYSTNIGGDVIVFVSLLFKISMLDAAKKLLKDFNLNISDRYPCFNGNEVKSIVLQRQEINALAEMLMKKLNGFYHICTEWFKLLVWIEQAYKNAEIDYTDSFYRWVRQGVRFYDRVTTEFINGTLREQVDLMRHFEKQYFIKMWGGGGHSE